MIFDFDPTEEMRSNFDYFLENEFHPVSRPKFRDVEEKERAMKVWWWMEVKNLQQVQKMNDFRMAFSNLTNIT